MHQRYEVLSGSGTVNNATPSIALIAAPLAGETIRLTAFVVSVTTAATGGSGVVTLKDGSNVIQRWDANGTMASQIHLGDALGYPLTPGNALNLVVENAVANQATAYASAVGYLMEP